MSPVAWRPAVVLTANDGWLLAVFGALSPERINNRSARPPAPRRVDGQHFTMGWWQSMCESQ